MAQLVVMGAVIKCSFGAAPGTLMVLPDSAVLGSSVPAANIMAFAPMVNVLPFGTCESIANPMVAAATAAALGALTPMPCLPMTVAPWTPGSPTVTVGGMKALSSSCKLMCMWGGSISIEMPGQFTTTVA